jgi:YidC/Oxa1 family membrane protein insertase
LELTVGNFGSILRFVFIAAAGLLVFTFFGKSHNTDVVPAIEHPSVAEPTPRAPYAYCDISTPEFHAQLTTRGATLKRFKLLTPKYSGGELSDLSTTPQPGVAPGTPEEHDPNAGSGYAPGTAHEYRQQLFVQFRNVTSPGASGVTEWGPKYDSVDWKLTRNDGKACEFIFSDADVELTKLVEVTGRPYELSVTSSIKNLNVAPRSHAVAIDTVDWWLDSAVQGSIFRPSPHITTVECAGRNDTAHRLHPDHFEPSHFEDPEFQAAGKYRWFQAPEPPTFAAVSNVYFSHALAPISSPAAPVCQLQVEMRHQAGAEPGAFYRARLAYPATSLAPGESASYKVLSYVGPKERRILAEAGGKGSELSDLIDLGFFSSIAKVLVGFLLKMHSIFGNWGIAIIMLTVCARVLLFPLALPGIKTMIKMRELKPEQDALNEKYKDDMRAKGVAQMELWRKNGLSPFDQVKGCLPQLATMPVWFALYTTLQTAVELYNIRFLWFPDLSQPDPYFVLPFVIGATYFLQQKIMPFQGDPAQRKMMLYMMPAMFTVFMLFLPAGLGVYMFTNSILAILQQQAVESHAKRSMDRGRISVSIKDPTEKPGAITTTKPKRTPAS